MSPMWCVLAPGRGCGRRIVLKWTLLRYIDQDKAVVKRVGGTLVCLLAEKLWNNAKFPIREPCKVTTVCSLSANWILPLQAALEGGQPGSEGSGTCTTDSRYQGSVTKCSSGWWFIRSGWKKEKANRLFLATNYSKGPQKQECQSKKKITNTALSYRNVMALCHRRLERKLVVLEKRKHTFLWWLLCT